MTDSIDPGLDPRFDPRFQRGYEGQPNPVQRSGGLQPNPVQRSGGLLPQTAPTAEPDPDAEQARPGDDLETDIEIWPDGPNPFVRALWIVSAVLVVVGLGLYLWATSGSTSYNNSAGVIPLNIIVQQTAWVLCPAMVTVGLATASGLLFWHAARWKPSGR